MDKKTNKYWEQDKNKEISRLKAELEKREDERLYYGIGGHLFTRHLIHSSSSACEETYIVV